MSTVLKEDIEQLLYDNDVNAEYVSTLVENLVEKCCNNLNKYIDYVSKVLKDTKETDYALTNDELDDIIMTIPTLLYFVSEQQEKLGIRHDISKSSRELLYNKIYMDTPGTAGFKKANADSQLFNESLVSIVYSRAYDIIKSKISFALEILQSAKKVMSRHISENEITKLSTGTTVDPFNKG